MSLTDNVYERIKADALREMSRWIVYDPEQQADDFDTVELRPIVNGWTSRNFSHAFAGFSTEEIVDAADVSEYEMKDEAMVSGRAGHFYDSQSVRQAAERAVEVDLHRSLRALDEEMEMVITIHDSIENIVGPDADVSLSLNPSAFVDDVYEWAETHNVDSEHGSLPPFEVSPAGKLVVDDVFKRRFNESHVRRVDGIDVVDPDPDRQQNPVISVVGAYLFEEWSDYVEECDLRFE